MAQQRLGIIMNGVTGRMGMNQHLIRSICAIRDQGGVALKNGDRVMPDPILVGRNADRLQKLAKAHGIARWTTDLDEALEGPEGHVVLRRRDHAAPRRAAEEGDRRPARTSIARSRCRRRSKDALDSRPRREEGRHQARRGAGQAVPAGPAQAQDADRLRLLRPHPRGARRVRLLGVRGRLAAGAAAVVELQEGRGRRHHPRHGVPLALRARQSVRRCRGRDVPRRDAYSRALGRERQAVQGRRRRRRLRDLPAQGRRHRAYQHVLVHARAPRRSRDVPCRRHARLGGGRPAASAGARRG